MGQEKKIPVRSGRAIIVQLRRYGKKRKKRKHIQRSSPTNSPSLSTIREGMTIIRKINIDEAGQDESQIHDHTRQSSVSRGRSNQKSRSIQYITTQSEQVYPAAPKVEKEQEQE